MNERTATGIQTKSDLMEWDGIMLPKLRMFWKLAESTNLKPVVAKIEEGPIMLCKFTGMNIYNEPGESS